MRDKANSKPTSNGTERDAISPDMGNSETTAKPTRSKTMTTTAKATKAATPKNPPKVSHAKAKPAMAELPTISAVKLVPLALIDVLPQVRTIFDDDSIADLASDIAARGLLQPILLNPNGNRFDLIAGERRVRACKQIGMTDIPALITKASSADALLMQLAENIQREDLDLADQVRAIRAIHDSLKSVAAVADTVKKSPAWVSKRLALSHPDLNWQAHNLINDGITEDVDLLYTLTAVAKLSYTEGCRLSDAIREGKATRETARTILKELKNPTTKEPDPEQEKKQLQRDEERQRRYANGEKIWEQARADREEGTGPAFIDWALTRIENGITYDDHDPAEFINGLKDDQRAAIVEHLRTVQDAAPTWTLTDWAGKLSDECDEHLTYIERLAAVMAMAGHMVADCYAITTLAWGAHGGKVEK